MKPAKVYLNVALVMFSLVVLFGVSFKSDAGATVAAPDTTNTTTTATNTSSADDSVATGLTTVNAGGNGSNWDKFIPQNMSIKAGESVTWDNPMLVEEPHTVTFFEDGNMMPPLLV